MSREYSIAFLRDEVARIIAPGISLRRASEAAINDEDTFDSKRPPTQQEIDEFLLQCPLESDELSLTFRRFFSSFDDTDTIELTDSEFHQFQQDVTGWSQNNTWLGADDWPTVTITGDVMFSRDFILQHQVRYNAEQLQLIDTRIEIARLSPSFAILEKIIGGEIDLDSLHWREFEELVADLLTQDGYAVELGPGQKDGGKDIVAIKDLGSSGLFKTVWQAKKLKPGNKVGISIIRELADVRSEQKASKGVLVTTTFLTRNALQRVRRDEYLLGKVDRDDLLKWIEAILRNRRRI